MATRRLTQRQKERIRSIQQKRIERAAAKSAPEPASQGPEQTGLVISHHGATLVVEDSAGTLHRCAVRQNLGSIVCGDEVVWQATAGGEGVVVAARERRSLLCRAGVDGRNRPVAANIDQIIVVAAAVPTPSEYLIDRYLVAAETTGIVPVVLVNKIDLPTPEEAARLRTRLRHYKTVGYRLLFASVRAEHGLESLFAQLQDRTSVLVGQSGVGKSSLVKALLPEREIRIGALNDAEHGRHTTSTSVLYHLPFGGRLIDSPGVRDFALSALDPVQLMQGFVEFRPYLGKCRFRDCRHTSEPNCAVRAAVDEGRIERRRWESYCGMLQDSG